MRRDHYVFGYDAEPADERPTGFGQTNFGQSGLVTLTTMPAPWTASEHSTFDEPSRSIDRVLARKRQRSLVNAGIAAMVLLAGAAVATLVTLAIRS
ncbi:MAG TPA: hypothetical protein VLJ62_15845 [Burkholderiaceae bacterium]|nr:hypothetical protein [Burkholderiaceae bacterium]